jgi:hypothetical protein
MNTKRKEPDQPAKSLVKTRDAQMMTADVYYADAEVNTKTKKNDFSI